MYNAAGLGEFATDILVQGNGQGESGKKMVSSDYMQLHHVKPAILAPTRGSPQTE